MKILDYKMEKCHKSLKKSNLICEYFYICKDIHLILFKN